MVSSPTVHRLAINALLLCFAVGALTAQAQTFLLDFGAGGTPTILGPSPDDPLNTWNNVTDTIGINPAGSLLDLRTTTNVATVVDLFMISRFNASNTNGTTGSTIFATHATQDSLFGNTESFNGLTNIFPAFKLTSLTPGLTYNLTFYASRTGVADNRETLYTISGSSTGSVTLNAANNVDNTVTFFGMSPSAAGEITISLTPGPNNTNTANHFTYLGAMQVVTIPEPSSALLAAGGVALLGCRRRRSLRRAF